MKLPVLSWQLLPFQFSLFNLISLLHSKSMPGWSKRSWTLKHLFYIISDDNEFHPSSSFSSYSAELEDERQTWVGSDRDYTYEELLTRVFEIMREKNPDMVAGKKQKFVMRPPQVVRIGTKKTSFANFTEICKTWVEFSEPNNQTNDVSFTNWRCIQLNIPLVFFGLNGRGCTRQ